MNSTTTFPFALWHKCVAVLCSLLLISACIPVSTAYAQDTTLTPSATTKTYSVVANISAPTPMGITAYVTNSNNPITTGSAPTSAVTSKNATLTDNKDGTYTLVLEIPNQAFTLQSLGTCSNAKVLSTTTSGDVIYGEETGNVTERISAVTILLTSLESSYVFADSSFYATPLLTSFVADATLTVEGFSISGASVTLNATSKTYTGSALKCGVKSVKLNGQTLTAGTDYSISYSNNKKIGKATVKITGKGNYAGTISKTFKINPKKVKLKSSTKSGSKKNLAVKWSKVSGSVSKYQVRYRKKGSSKWTTKTISSSKSSYTISKLKSGKKYQVQVRAYKTVSGTKYYGSWSAVKTVKVK